MTGSADTAGMSTSTSLSTPTAGSHPVRALTLRESLVRLGKRERRAVEVLALALSCTAVAVMPLTLSVASGSGECAQPRCAVQVRVVDLLVEGALR